MERREFLKAGATAAAVAAAKPLFGWQGANDRVRMGVIGMGGRSARVFDSLTRHQDCQFTIGCEVSQAKLQGFQSANRPLAQIPIVPIAACLFDSGGKGVGNSGIGMSQRSSLGATL
jgi:hypothetical protein